MLLQHHLVFPVTLTFHASIPQCVNHCLLALSGWSSLTFTLLQVWFVQLLYRTAALVKNAL